ncbi:hypothetical protein BDV19DRAFT_358141 [Aspergillus venezuelensis]
MMRCFKACGQRQSLSMVFAFHAIPGEHAYRPTEAYIQVIRTETSRRVVSKGRVSTVEGPWCSYTGNVLRCKSMDRARYKGTMARESHSYERSPVKMTSVS